VCGGTQAGKTTVLNALASAVPRSERVITIEEVFELTPQLPDVIQMQTRSPNLQGEGEIPLRRLIKESLRMRPTRIIVGEVREAEALDLLIALNSGLPGIGNSSCKLSHEMQLLSCKLCHLLAGENISHKFIAPTVASAIDLVVHATLDASGMRRINEVAAVTGRYENDRAEIEMLWKWDGNQYIRGVGSLPHPEKFEIIGSPLSSWWHA
jgi:pilus assembly protein CpaF